MITRLTDDNIYEHLEKDVGEVLDQPQHPKGCYNAVFVKIQSIIDDIVSEKYTQVHGLTLTFRKRYHGYPIKWLHRQVLNRLSRSRIFRTRNYLLFPELTEKNGILHYHGIVWNQYQIDTMKMINWWRREYGFAKPELALKSRVKWIEYITKDYGKTGLYSFFNDNGNKISLKERDFNSDFNFVTTNKINKKTINIDDNVPIHYEIVIPNLRRKVFYDPIEKRFKEIVIPRTIYE